MCLKNKNCLCHLIKPAIQNDNEEKFKAFFQKSFNADLYHFLKASYALLQEEKNTDFNTALENLIMEFINEDADEEINLNYQERKSIMFAFNSYLKGESDIKSAKEILAKLTYKFERFLYDALLVRDDGFEDYLKQYKNVEIIITISKEPLKLYNNSEVIIGPIKETGSEQQQGSQQEVDENTTSCCECTLF